MKKTNILYIISIVFVFISIVIFELLYCNSNFMEQILFRKPNYANYNFSFFRMIIYIASIVLIIVFKKQLKDILEEMKESKIRRNVMIVYCVMAILGLIYVTSKLIMNKLLLPKIAVEYIGILLTGICLAYLSKDYVKNIAVITLTISMIFVITIDINNTLDEKRHFMSAYCLSTGQFSFSNAKMEKSFWELGHFNKYTNISKLFENNFKENLIEDYDKSDKPSTPAEYNQLIYVPSAIGIIIAKIFSNNMADIYFAGRLFNLITYAVLVIIALKLLPYKKNTFFVIFSMPLLFALGSVYSADTVSMGIVAIFSAYCLRLKEIDRIEKKQIIKLCLLLVLLSVPKSMTYVFVALIVFTLPLKKIIKQNKKNIQYIIFWGVVALALILLLNTSNGELKADPRGGNTSLLGQIKYLLSNPIEAVKLGINHIRLTLANYNWLKGLNLEIYFSNDADKVFLFMMLFILYVSLTDNSKNFDIKEKILFILAFFITYAISSFMLYIMFTPVGSKEILGYQTRYIFPILPLLMMCLSNSNISLKNTENQELKISYISTFFVILSAIGSTIM